MSNDPEIYGKNAKKLGVTPAVAMVNPKNPYNVGAALRAAYCFGGATGLVHRLTGRSWAKGSAPFAARGAHEGLPRC